MTDPEVKNEIIVDAKAYHTIKEVKNGQGPAPIKTEQGWLHLAHGVRNTAAGLRYVLYMFMTELAKTLAGNPPACRILYRSRKERNEWVMFRMSLLAMGGLSMIVMKYLFIMHHPIPGCMLLPPVKKDWWTMSCILRKTLYFHIFVLPRELH